MCGSRKSIDLDHIDGDEANDAQPNKQWLCRSCNSTKGKHFARQGYGKLTRQFNPSRPPAAARNPGAQSVQEFITTLMILKGQTDGNLQDAIDKMHATSAAKRSEFQRDLWTYRRARKAAW